MNIKYFQIVVLYFLLAKFYETTMSNKLTPVEAATVFGILAMTPITSSVTLEGPDPFPLISMTIVMRSHWDMGAATSAAIFGRDSIIRSIYDLNMIF